MKFYIFRHAQTFATLHNDDYGIHVLDAPILESGVEPIKRLGEYLIDSTPDFCVTSDLERCVETAKIVEEETNQKFTLDKRLEEPYQETHEQVLERVMDFYQEITSQDFQVVWICTHGAIISLLNHLILNNGRMDEYSTMSYPLPGVLEIIEDNNLHEIDFNNR